MNTPLVTWSCIVGLFVLIIAVRLIHAARLFPAGKHRLIDFGSEREEFFVPGDVIEDNEKDYYDYDDI